MALTDLQRAVCRLLADHRIASGESYVAGGVALNEMMATPRTSRDIDLFHDTDEDEVRTLAFAGQPPDAADLSRRWHAMLSTARQIIDALPPAELGQCVLGADGLLFTNGPAELRATLASGRLMFHPGRIRGALPQVKH